MELQLNAGEVCLTDNHPVCLRHARGQKIRCTAGILWITEEGRRTDVFLHAGECYRIGSDGLTVVESIGHGRFMLVNSVSGSPTSAAPQNLALA